MNNYMQQIFEILLLCILFIFIFYSVYRIIIMHEVLSAITKKLIAQNLPYFYQNSLKIFINLTDCWKKIWQLWKIKQ